MDAELFIQNARAYLGTPFLHQGRVKGVGIDCAGVVECAARDSGYDIPVHDGYGRQPYQGQLEAKLEQYLERTDELSPGCVLLIKFPKAPASHVAIYTGKTLIHAYESVGQCIEHDYTPAWQKLTLRAYQWPIR